MKNSPLTAVLLGALAISALASVWLCWSYSSNARQLRQLQSNLNVINNRNTAINSLAMETLEFSKTHPDVNPILESAGVKPRSGVTPPTATPTTKAPGK